MAVMKPNPDHPAKFSDAILDRLALYVRREAQKMGYPPLVLDPFAGVGRVHQLQDVGCATVGVELEPEWAACHPRTEVGDATRLRFADHSFDLAVSSCCYGNRMSDHHNAQDGSKRRGYRFSLGRMPSPGSAAVLPFGQAYKDLHDLAWSEVSRVLRWPTWTAGGELAGGLAMINVSDHIRDGKRVQVVDWHAESLERNGLKVERVVPVGTPRMRYGENYDARVEAEMIILARKPA